MSRVGLLSLTLISSAYHGALALGASPLRNGVGGLEQAGGPVGEGTLPSYLWVCVFAQVRRKRPGQKDYWAFELSLRTTNIDSRSCPKELTFL